jgi:hypothetical protein
MLNDLAVGVDHQKEFLEHLKTKHIGLGKIAADDFTVKVLTTGYWPSYPIYDVVLPPEMQKCVQVRHAAHAFLTCLATIL